MARILVSDTEAFAPTYKSTYVPLEELPKDKQLRRLSAEIGLAEKAIPLADLVARGGSTLYGGIKDWFAEREQKEEAEKAGARGGKQLPPEDFSGAEAKAEPTVTQAGVAQAEPIKAGGPVSLPDLERAKIAQQRLEQIKKQELGFPQREPKLSLEHREVAAPTPPAEPSALDRLSLQRKRTQKPGELSLQTKPEDWFSRPPPREEPSVVGTYLPGKQGQETEYEKTPGFDPLWVSSQSLMPEREKELGELLGKQPPMSIRQMRSPQLAQPEMGESGDWFQPELKLKGMPVAAAMTPAQRAEALRLAMPEAAAPSAPAADKIAQAEAIMAEERRKSPGAVTPAGAQPEAWSAPATRTTVVGDPFKEGKQTIELAPTRETGAALIDKYKTAAAAEAAAKAEKEAAATPKPAAPKTIGEATDDQLKMLKSRLESVAGRNLTEEQRQDLTGRLKDINDELDYRKTKDEPRTYSQWEALARVADTPEKQARVLELAKNVHMPAGGLADLLSPSAQLAERQAMGTRGEPGLFPPMAKKTGLIELAKAAKYEAEANKINLSNPYEQALFEAKINEKLANAGYTDVKGSDVMALIAPKAVAMEELGHQRHEMADYYAARAKAEDARARFRAANRGGAGRDDMFKWGKEWNDVAAERVRAAQKVATEAIDSAEKASLKAQDSAQHASRLAEDVGKPPEPPKGLDKTNPKLVEQYQESLRKHKEREAAAAAAARAAAADRAFAEQKDGERRAAQTQLKDSVTAGDEAYREYQTLYEERRGRPIGTPPAYKQPRPAAPPIKKEAPSTAPPAAPKEGDKKDVTLKNGSKVKAVFKGGKWVRAE